MAMFGAISFVPLFLQSVTGTTATGAGMVLTPFILGWVAMSVTSARLVLRVGYRAVVMTGMACLTGAFLLFARWSRSEEHTSELQSLAYLVCRLLLEKKK